VSAADSTAPGGDQKVPPGDQKGPPGDKYPVLILGAGKIGRGIARILHLSGKYDVLVGDISQAALDALRAETAVATAVVNARQSSPPARSSRTRGSPSPP
jgi:3-hydroxyacyl-CoA dehydrogenase